MKLTVFGREVLSFGTPAEPPPPVHFTGYEYKCYHCGEMLVTRKTPLIDRDLEDLRALHVCE